jgi:Arc/MetJ-type ribon-helix-helix transcriptional regulator
MSRLTISITDDETELIDANVGDGKQYESKSAFVRECIRRYEHSRQLEAKVDDLQRQLREANRRNDEIQELAEYVDREKQLQVDEREKRNAPLLKRIEWLIFGYDGG